MPSINLSKINNNNWECQESNSGLLGEKCECNLCAIPLLKGVPCIVTRYFCQEKNWLFQILGYSCYLNLKKSQKVLDSSASARNRPETFGQLQSITTGSQTPFCSNCSSLCSSAWVNNESSDCKKQHFVWQPKIAKKQTFLFYPTKFLHWQRS